MNYPNRSSGNLTADRRLEQAQLFMARGDMDAAADLLEQTFALAPDWAPLYFRLGECRMELGQRDDAARNFTRYLALDPADTMGAAIKLALLGAAPAPQTLPPRYVEQLFDDYAPRFDKALVERLDYSVPQLLSDAVTRVRPVKDHSERILDLGCGTGLSGAPFAPRAAWLEGIDLSAAMIAQAQARNIYNNLVQGNILGDADLHPPYDLVIAADVLVYIGALEDLFKKIRSLTAPAGLFAFSTQKLDNGAYELGADHRYAHSRAYLEQCAAGAGFSVSSMEDAVLRQDKGTAVPGWICVLHY